MSERRDRTVAPGLSEREDELVAGLALSALSDDEAAEARRLIAEKPAARDAFYGYVEASAALGAASDSIDVPDHVREGIRAGIAAHTAEQVSDAAPVPDLRGPRYPRRRSLLRGALAPTLAAACAMLALIGVSQQAQIGNLGKEVDGLREAAGSNAERGGMMGDSHVVSLQTTGAMQDAHAEVVVWNDTAVLVAEDLPDPPDGFMWRVWAMHPGDSTDGMLDLDHGDAAMVMPLGNIDADDTTGFMITLEPIDAAGDGSRPQGAQAAHGVMA